MNFRPREKKREMLDQGVGFIKTQSLTPVYI